MRIIKQVDIVNAQGSKSYFIGHTVNGLKIATMELYANDGMTELVMKDTDKKLVVNIVNCPMVIEYVEVES